MSPINITNILLRLAAYNKNLNAANQNINNQNKYHRLNHNHRGLNPNIQTANPNAQINTPKHPTISQHPTASNSNINLNDNVNNILNREIVNKQNLNNVVKQNNVLAQNNNINNLLNTSHKGIINTAKTLSPNITGQAAVLNARTQNINNVKEMMNLPKEMNDVLTLIQNQAQNQAKATQQANGLILNNINIKSLTQLIQSGSKEALIKLLNTTAAQTLTPAEMHQIEEAVSYLSTNTSSQDSQTQALKNFMLLYLPWLPLEEGMDFELNFSFEESSEECDENIMNISIITRHFGQIHVLIILKSISSFEIFVKCCKEFPKETLLKLVAEDEKKHTLQTNYVFEEQRVADPIPSAKEAKIMLSNINEISPFLLLIANSIIKNTLLLDVD